MQDFFFNPNNGGPKFENFLITSILASLMGYYLYSSKGSEEISYNEFINNYLTKNQIELITISEEKTSD